MSTAPATRRPLAETARQHHHSRSRGLGPVRTEPDDHAERAARPESRRPPDPYPPSEPEPRPESPASARTQSGRTLPATALVGDLVGEARVPESVEPAWTPWARPCRP